MRIVFGILSFVVIITTIVYLVIGTAGDIIPNVSVRWFLENLFAVFKDFPFCFILYLHHVNYRVKEKSQL